MRPDLSRVELDASEVLVLKAISNGLRPSEAAEVLGWGMWTVQWTLRNARRKLAAKNTAHAIANAFRAGLIQ